MHKTGLFVLFLFFPHLSHLSHREVQTDSDGAELSSFLFTHPPDVISYVPFVIEGRKEHRDKCSSQVNVSEEELCNGNASFCTDHARNLKNSLKTMSFVSGWLELAAMNPSSQWHTNLTAQKITELSDCLSNSYKLYCWSQCTLRNTFCCANIHFIFEHCFRLGRFLIEKNGQVHRCLCFLKFDECKPAPKPDKTRAEISVKQL